MRTGCACIGATPLGVETTQGFVPADTVLDATGMLPSDETIAAFHDCAPIVKAAGDCTDPQLIGYAVRAAYEAAVEI